MTDVLLILLIIIFIFTYYVIIPYQVKRRRKSLKKASFPLDWHNFLESNIYLYRILPPQLKLDLQDHIKIFLAEKQFIGKNGFTITLDVKLSIASQATKNIPDTIRIKHPYIDWRSIIGLRNIIVHTYFCINNDILWNTIKNDFIVLQQYITSIQETENLDIK